MYMTVYIRFILNRLGRLRIKKENAGNTWKQGHKQKYILIMFCIYTLLLLL